MNKKDYPKGFSIKYSLLFFILFVLVILLDRFVINKPNYNLVDIHKEDQINIEVTTSDYNRGSLIFNDSILLQSYQFINIDDYESRLLTIALYKLPMYVSKEKDNDTLIIKHGNQTDYLIYK